MARVALLVLVSLVVCACDGGPRAWEDRDGGSAEVLSAPAPAPLEAGIAAAEGDAGDAGDEVVEPARVGGPWVRCYGGFHASGDPVKDVTRLSLLCGPQNGMRRLSRAPFEGSVREGGPAVSQEFEAKRGECYRVFAVAEPGVGDLDVSVRTSRGMPVAADHGEDAWPIVQPDRPFCALDDDRYTVGVTARRGEGRFAGEVWRLPSR